MKETGNGINERIKNLVAMQHTFQDCVLKSIDKINEKIQKLEERLFRMEKVLIKDIASGSPPEKKTASEWLEMLNRDRGEITPLSPDHIVRVGDDIQIPARQDSIEICLVCKIGSSVYLINNKSGKEEYAINIDFGSFEDIDLVKYLGLFAEDSKIIKRGSNWRIKIK